jgi:hypothetical protein
MHVRRVAAHKGRRYSGNNSSLLTGEPVASARGSDWETEGYRPYTVGGTSEEKLIAADPSLGVVFLAFAHQLVELPLGPPCGRKSKKEETEWLARFPGARSPWQRLCALRA